MDWVDVRQMQDMMAKGAVVLDVREAGEFAQAHIEGAVNVPLSSFTPEVAGTYFAQCKAEQPLVLLCLSSVRSARAGSLLPENVRYAVVEGGMHAWRAAGLPVVEGPKSGFFSRLMGV